MEIFKVFLVRCRVASVAVAFDCYRLDAPHCYAPVERVELAREGMGAVVATRNLWLSSPQETIPRIERIR